MSLDAGHAAVKLLVGVVLVALAVAGNARVAGRLGGNAPPASFPAPAAAPFQAAVSSPLTPVGGPLVTPAPPSRIRIPRIGLSAPVSPLQAADLAIPAPPDPGVAGWYTRGPVPGEVGPAVIVGHLDSSHGPAIFWRLPDLRQGDDVIVSRVDGSSARFVVARSARYARASFPSADVYGPTVAAELRLITCGGGFNFLSGQYSDNVVVYATMA